MKTIGLILRPGNSRAEALARELVGFIEKLGHRVLCENETGKILALTGVSAERLITEADPIVTLGGDGTLIAAARHVRGKSPVMLGVNFGTLGFLTEIAPDELFMALELVLANKASLGSRTMLAVEVVRAGKRIFGAQAVNDAVVQKGTTDRLMDLDLAVGDEELLRMRADGVIVSTPTGSTAYGLSAGGPILHPSLAVMSVTAVCAHSLTFRPLVLPIESNLAVSVPAYEGTILLTIDGQESTSLEPGDRVNIKKSPNSVTFVHSPKRSYFEILRNKLNWGIGNK